MAKEKEATTARPVAVLISDVHYNIKNLALADGAMRQAIDKAVELGVQLIVAGDLHDTKATLRGECVNAMIATFKYAERTGLAHVLVGNHCKINEKSDEHSLEFLKSYAYVIDSPECIMGRHYIPYQHDAAEFERILSDIPKGSTVICHQGVTGAESGEYTYDKSAVDKNILKDHRVISGHYHRAQDIKCGPPRKGAVGLTSYIGTPYTVTFAEANDGPKGFQILYSDGLLEQVPTNLRKHVIMQYLLDPAGTVISRSAKTEPGDLLWVKVTGSALELDKLSKDDIKSALSLDNTSFKLDKIPNDTPQLQAKEVEHKTTWEIMDNLIEGSGETVEKQSELKDLLRKVMTC